MYKVKQTFLLATIAILVTQAGCKKPYRLPYDNIGGYVIGKETCNSDETQDYWLLDFTVYPNTPILGDTLTLNSITYTNVLKVKGLDPRLKQTGMRVSIDYNVISPSQVITVGCNVPVSTTYSLKEIFIIYQGEIR